MRLKKIEIQGFKSFANKTRLSFCDGITAIIGPNGSGKSNIADAIKWVLGEQSAKSLRGKKGDDVIFAGSEKKSQISIASVFLSFDNSDRKIPLDFEEISIGRKIFRDGTGQYFINGSRVKLSEIIEKMAASGAGQGEHSMINQGVTDRILNATPVQRRLILEGASGIKQFRIKRDQAQKKIEATRGNIARISDLAVEIEPRLRILRRQAAKMEKREELEKELREKQRVFYGAKMRDLEKKRAEFGEKKNRIKPEMDFVEKDLRTLENIFKEESKKESLGQEQILKIREKLQSLSLERRETEREAAVLEGKKTLLESAVELKKSRIKNIKGEKERKKISAEKSETEQKNKKAIVELKVLSDLFIEISKAEGGSIENLKKILDKCLKFLKNILDKNKEEKTELDFSREDSEIKLLEKEFISDEKNLKIFTENLSKKELLLADIEQKIAKLDAEIEKINKEDHERRSGFFETERKIRIKRSELDEAKSKENAIAIEESRVLVHIEDLEKEIKEQLGEFKIKAGLAPDLNISELDISIRKLKSQLEQIGGIDGLTIEEYKQTEERFNYLNKEIGDLEKSEKNLFELIKKLDSEMEKKFNSSFKNIAAEFEKYFKMVFGGGEAKIFYSKVKNESLEDDGENGASAIESAIETGVEITAIPPGKKTKNLSVLSGGERALTSIALLFAIIANDPPPFCVLDEVDAALDEANSSRIGQIFGKLAEKTQFIVITHNREIMSKASALYGVTMQKDGISQLFSVKLTSND